MLFRFSIGPPKGRCRQIGNPNGQARTCYLRGSCPALWMWRDRLDTRMASNQLSVTRAPPEPDIAKTRYCQMPSAGVHLTYSMLCARSIAIDLHVNGILMQWHCPRWGYRNRPKIATKTLAWIASFLCLCFQVSLDRPMTSPGGKLEAQAYQLTHFGSRTEK